MLLLQYGAVMPTSHNLNVAFCVDQETGERIPGTQVTIFELGSLPNCAETGYAEVLSKKTEFIF